MLSLLAACGGGRDSLNLRLQVAVDGVAVAGSPVTGGSTDISMVSGQTLSVDANLEITVIDSLGSASGSTVSRSGTSWSSMLVSAEATTATLVISSRDDPSLTATLNVAIAPVPLAVDVTVNGGLVTSVPVAEGDDTSFSIASGQTVALVSNIKSDVAVDFGSARSSGRVTTSSTWQATLTSEVATEVVFTITPQGDGSRSAKIRVQIAPTALAVNVLVDGVASNTNAILAGETWTVRMSSGHALSINSSVAMVVDETLGTASKSSYTKTATAWAATLSGAAAAEATLVVRSNADSSLTATIKVILDPPPMQVSVKVGGEVVTSGPLNSGSASFSVLSGQKVVVSSSTLRIDVSELLNTATVSGRTSTPNAWGGAISSATATSVVLTVTPQGDTSRSVVLTFNISPTPLQLMVAIEGNVGTAGPVLAGQVLSVALTSGLQVIIDGSVSFTVAETLNGATRSALTKTANQYKANFTSASGSEVLLTVTSAADSTLSATIKLSVAPQVYSNTIAHTVSEFSRFETSTVQLDGTTLTTSTANTVQTVDSDGSYTSLASVAGTASATKTFSADGNLTTCISQPGSKLCVPPQAGTPRLTRCNYSPSLELLSFPLYVGKTASAAWSSSCTNGVSETAAAVSNVQGVETVNVGGTSMQALRVRIDVSVSGSNDPLLQGGSSGTASYSQVWYCKWAIPLQRTVFCGRDTSYVGTAPTYYPSSYSETMSQYSKP